MRGLTVKALGAIAAFLVAAGAYVPAAAANSGQKVLPLSICLSQPTSVNGVVACRPAISKLPKDRTFYLFVLTTAEQGLQTYGLDVTVQQWQPKKRRWVTMRQEVGVKIQPDWQYVWFRQKGLAPGSYRAFVATDFLAKLVSAPEFTFEGSFTVH